MAGAQRHAEVRWEGNLTQGRGRVTVGSGAFSEFPITWASRTERADGKTSPRGVDRRRPRGVLRNGAFAHANAGRHAAREPGRHGCLHARPGGWGFKITTIDLEVRGRVQGLDQTAFEQAARKAEQSCPVSNVLRNNVQIRLKSQVETKASV